jgi:hypothetical protein
MSTVAQEQVLLPADHVREVTDDEVARYQRDGWVMLEGLLSPELAAALLETAQERARTSEAAAMATAAGAWGQACVALAPDVPLFARLAFSREMGRNAWKLIDRRRLTAEPIGVRYFADGLAMRPGNGEGPSTHFHQDYPAQSQDRDGAVNFWVALAPVGPAQGGMRFLTGSQRESRLGPLYDAGPPNPRDAAARFPSLEDLRYPRLGAEYELTPGIEYAAGDATVHNPYMVHCAPANMSPEARWNYLASYVSADVRYNGTPNHVLDALALTPGQLFDHERFPLVYEDEGAPLS